MRMRSPEVSNLLSMKHITAIVLYLNNLTLLTDCIIKLTGNAIECILIMQELRNSLTKFKQRNHVFI